MNKDKFGNEGKFENSSRCGNKLFQLSQYLLKYHDFGKREREDHTMETQYLLNEIKDNAVRLEFIMNSAQKLDENIGEASGIKDVKKILGLGGFNEVPFFWAFIGGQTFLPSLLQTLSYAQKSHLYETMAINTSGVSDHDYLRNAPEPGSNLLFVFTKRNLTKGSTAWIQNSVDILYNGQFINYCGAKDLLVGCSLENFVDFVHGVSIPMTQFWPLCKVNEATVKTRESIMYIILVLLVFM